MFSARYLAGVAILATTSNAEASATPIASYTGTSCAKAARKTGSHSRKKIANNSNSEHESGGRCSSYSTPGFSPKESIFYNGIAAAVFGLNRDEWEEIPNGFAFELWSAIREVIKEVKRHPEDPTKHREHELRQVAWEGLVNAFPFFTKDELEQNEKLETLYEDVFMEFRNYALSFEETCIDKTFFYTCYFQWTESSREAEHVTSLFVWRCIFEQMMAKCQVEAETTHWYKAFKYEQFCRLDEVHELKLINSCLQFMYAMATEYHGKNKEWVDRLIDHALMLFGDGVDRTTMIKNIYDHYMTKPGSPGAKGLTLRQVAEDYGFFE